MHRTVILHQMTAMHVSPAELPKLAADIGCRQVSLFTYVPQSGLPEENSGFVFPLVTPETKGDVLSALAAHDISVSGVEFFPVTADIDVETFARSLALGRELGASRAVTLVFDEEGSRAVDKLGKLGDMAAAEELSLSLEFTPLTRGCRSLRQAVDFVDRVGRSRLGIGIDTLHLVRSGGTPADLLALDSDYFRYSQLCDGHGVQASDDYYAETHNRELPGKGDFPLEDILNALPGSIDLEVEVPAEARWSHGVSPQQHAQDAVTHAQALVDGLKPKR